MAKPIRPSFGDTEEDLLRFQEEFLSSGSGTSATVVDRRPAGGRDVIQLSKPGSSDPAPSGKLSPQAKKAKVNEHQEDQDAGQLLDEHERKHHVGSVLSSVTERDTSSRVACMPTASSCIGFPQAMPVDHGTQSRSRSVARGGKKRSLFAQQFDRQNPRQAPKQTPEASSSQPASGSSIISGSGLHEDSKASHQEAQRIHEENVAKMASLGPEEILEEQRRLMATLGPDVVQFMKTRGDGKGVKAAAAPASSGSAGVSGDVDQATRDERHVRFAPPPGRKQKSSVSGGCVSDAVPGDQSKDWLHMDKEEQEKMEWMHDLPDDTAKRAVLEKACPARFSFAGELITPEEGASLPSHLGLHHHGDNPELAGYSLSELFVLARSSMHQQQIIALETLAAIICKALAGDYAQRLEADLVSKLLDAGLPLLLRWALDDSRMSVFCMALDGLHGLLVSRHDQVMSDLVATTVPCLGVEALSVPEDTEDEDSDSETEEPTDEEVIATDLVKGLLRTNILHRLRYLLEVCSLPGTAVAAVLDILIRFSQHSLQTTAEIARCPRLVDTVVNMFLPLAWSGEALEEPSYGLPSALALQLITSLCRSGRHMAAQLATKYDLISRIGRYLSVPASELGLSGTRGHELQAAAWSLWQVLVLYSQSCDFFTTMQESILSHLQATGALLRSGAMQTVAEVAAPEAMQTEDGGADLVSRQPVAVATALQRQVECAVSMLALLESAVHVAACRDADLQTWQAEEKLLGKSSHGTAGPDLGDAAESSRKHEVWTKLSVHQVQAWFTVVSSWLEISLSMFTAPASGAEHISLLSSTLSFVSAFISRLGSALYTPVDLVDNANTILSVLYEWLQKPAFHQVCTRVESVLSLLRQPPTTPPIASLPQRGCSSEVSSSSAADLLLFHSIVKLSSTLQRIHKGQNDKIAVQFIGHSATQAIVKGMLVHPLKVQHPLSAVERLASFSLCKLALTVVRDMTHCAAGLLLHPFHQVALQLVCRFKPGEEALAKDLLSSVIFDPKLLRPSCSGVAAALANLSLSGDVHRACDGEDLLQSLPDIRATFLALIGSQPGSQRSLWYSKVRHHPQPCLLPAVLLPSQRSSLLPVDWMFLPLLEAFSQSTTPGQLHSESDNVSDHVCRAVGHCLQWLVVLETCQPLCIAPLHVTVKVARVLCVFLVGANLFLQTDIQKSLVSLLRLYTQPCFLSSLTFDQPIPGLSSLYDFYVALVAQYDAVSYGHELFASFVMLPMLRSSPLSNRRLIWQENETVLQTITLSAAMSSVPLHCYLEPIENDPLLLQLYLQALVRGFVRPQCSLLYCIAVHHVSNYLFADREDAKSPAAVLRAMVAFLLMQKNQTVFHHVVGYQSSDPGAALGFQFQSTPPTKRLQCLAKEVRRCGPQSGLGAAVQQLHPDIFELAAQD